MSFVKSVLESVKEDLIAGIERMEGDKVQLENRLDDTHKRINAHKEKLAEVEKELEARE